MPDAILSHGTCADMSEIHAGILCAAMTISLCAALHGCLCAFYYKMPRARAICPLMLIIGFAALSLLIAHLPDPSALHSGIWTALTGLLFILNGAMLIFLLRWIGSHVSRISIKESCDRLPAALCFAADNGRPRLMNLRMDEMSHALTGETLANANHFWAAISSGGEHTIVTLPDGRIWSFERTQMHPNGEIIHQIIGVDVTTEARLNRQLNAENARLADLNARLKQYGKNVEMVVREKEILLAKARIHDELGRMLLRTRRLFTSDPQEDGAAVRAAWRQNIQLILSPAEAKLDITPMEQLMQAARAIGVTIEKRGAFPTDGTENAQLIEAAAHECLTNLVRHARGSLLEMNARRIAGGWRIEYQNDGCAPDAPIAEGGGLSSLRRRVESAGGTMMIVHAPRFLLTLILPEDTEVPIP